MLLLSLVISGLLGLWCYESSATIRRLTQGTGRRTRDVTWQLNKHWRKQRAQQQARGHDVTKPRTLSYKFQTLQVILCTYSLQVIPYHSFILLSFFSFSWSVSKSLRSFSLWLHLLEPFWNNNLGSRLYSRSCESNVFSKEVLSLFSVQPWAKPLALTLQILSNSLKAKSLSKQPLWVLKLEIETLRDVKNTEKKTKRRQRILNH